MLANTTSAIHEVTRCIWLNSEATFTSQWCPAIWQFHRHQKLQKQSPFPTLSSIIFTVAVVTAAAGQPTSYTSVLWQALASCSSSSTWRVTVLFLSLLDKHWTKYLEVIGCLGFPLKWYHRWYQVWYMWDRKGTEKVLWGGCDSSVLFVSMYN